MESFNKFCQLISEDTGLPSFYKKTTRIFYPKKIKNKLSPEFIDSYKTELKRLVETEGLKPQQASQSITKALALFHSEL